MLWVASTNIYGQAEIDAQIMHVPTAVAMFHSLLIGIHIDALPNTISQIYDLELAM